MSFEDAEIHRGISSERYKHWNQPELRGDPAWRVSRTDLKHVLESPEAFMAGGTAKESKSLDFGSLVDCLITEPEQFAKKYVLAPPTYPKSKTTGRAPNKVTTTTEAKWSSQSHTCQAWVKEQRQAGRIVVSGGKDGATYTGAQDAARAIRNHRPYPDRDLTLGQLIEVCDKQLVVTADWHDPSGVRIPCRCMIDLARGLGGNQPPILYDIKTAAESNRREFGFAIKKFGYDIQAWMYSQMLACALDYEGPIRFGYVPVRNKFPHLAATYMAGPERLRDGEKKFRQAMATYCSCLKSGKWPGYTEGFEEI